MFAIHILLVIKNISLSERSEESDSILVKKRIRLFARFTPSEKRNMLVTNNI